MANLPPLLVDLPRSPIFAVGLPVVLGMGSAILTNQGKYGPDSLYNKTLKQAEFAPPKSAFGIVWPTLFAAMGYSSHLIVKSLDKTPPGFGRQRASRALTLYYTQLALTQAFTPIRFVFGQVGLSVVNMLALTGTVGYWVAELKDVNETAFYLNLPYLAWSAFASALSVRTWWINGGESQIKGLWGDAKNKADKAKK